MNHKIKLAVIYGGKSGEHDVSLQTALSVINTLDEQKYDRYPIYITRDGKWLNGPLLSGKVKDAQSLDLTREEAFLALQALSTAGQGDTSLTASSSGRITDPFYQDTSSAAFDVVFPLLHGPNGEDGTIQGMMELLDVPYVGAGVLASAAGMDKVIMKHLFAQAGLPQGDFTFLLRKRWEKEPDAVMDAIEERLGYPCFVKPANLGSSVGISKVKHRGDLEKALNLAFQYDRKVIIEEFIDAREIEVAILGNEEPIVSVAGEIVPCNEFYDYKAKYIDGKSAMIIPAEISKAQYEEIKRLAKLAYEAIDGSGLTRADFFLTKKDERLLLNEVNTMPGFTPFSMYPLLWKNSGVPYAELIDRLIQLALERYEDKRKTRFDFSVE